MRNSVIHGVLEAKSQIVPSLTARNHWLTSNRYLIHQVEVFLTIPKSPDSSAGQTDPRRTTQGAWAMEEFRVQTGTAEITLA